MEDLPTATDFVLLALSATLPTMDFLWSPWRYAYIKEAHKSTGCVFCEKAAEGNDRGALIVYRGKTCYIILNAYPYTSGHVMVVPYAHLDTLAKLPAETATEMILLCQRMETVLRKLYQPEGLNLGMNIGAAAGAGVAGHVHMHVLPRWTADANFMTVVGETRVLPEALEETYERIYSALQQL